MLPQPDPPSLTKIQSESLSAEIDLMGAQLFTLRDGGGRDLLWNGDPAIWSGRAPLLFPIVGSLAGNSYRHAGRTYHLPRHGFARNRRFALHKATPASATFRLGWDDSTLQLYPFAFELDVTFSLSGASLAISADIRNLGAADMPASFGFHPALCWPLPGGEPRSAYSLLFDRDEPAAIRRLTPDGLLRDKAEPSPVQGRRLVLRDELFLPDALVFDRLESRGLWYGAESGPRVRIDFPGMPNLGIWTKPGAGFVCIEPWQGHSDPENFTGDLESKPGIFLVRAGQTHRCAMSIAWHMNR